MVIPNVMVTVASGVVMGSMISSRRKQKKKKSAVLPSKSHPIRAGEPSGAASTGEEASQRSPASKQGVDNDLAYDGAKQASATREGSGSPYFDPIDDEASHSRSLGPTVQSAVVLTHRADSPHQKTPESGLESATPILANSGDVVSTIEAGLPDIIPEDAIVLDPANSARQYAEDPHTALKREVWRPGDPDGKETADGHDRKPAFEKRWRFYQSSTGTERVSATHMPPKFVLLDDKAAYEVMSSDIPKARMAKFWPIDFVPNGKIRGKRAHRGRAAVANAAAEGDARYYAGELGSKDREPYPFRGAKDYRPIIYRSANPVSEASSAPDQASKKRKASSPASSSAAAPSSNSSIKRKHNNQYTPKELMVKHGGAPSQDAGRARYLPRINTFLRRDPSPDFAKDRSKLYGNIGEQARAAMAMSLRGADVGASRVDSGVRSVGGSGLGDWVGDVGAGLKRVEKDDEAEESLFLEEVEQATTTRDSVSAAGFSIEDDGEDDDTVPRASFVESATAATTPSTGNRRRKQIQQPRSFMEQMVATNSNAQQLDQQSVAHDAERGNAGIDSGSYATQLEQQLVGAGKEIQNLTSDLGAAQAKILQLEAEIAHLRSGLADVAEATDAQTDEDDTEMTSR
ncbi:hypothetical protein LTR86_008228 [Recurvomyces mirabilis]|nr:hypothetical protein LTR86_008228 [Recurvomyces mirabilis]